MTEYLQKSLNTGLGLDLLEDRRARLLLAISTSSASGEPTHVGLSGEGEGMIRTPASDDWYPVDLATNSYGQGLAVTPLQVLTAVSSLANGGVLMRPYVVSRIATGGEVRTFQPVQVRRTVSEDTARTVMRMMYEVVEGVPYHGARVPGYHVAGKTGTTLVSIPDGVRPRHHHRVVRRVHPVRGPAGRHPRQDRPAGRWAEPRWAGGGARVLEDGRRHHGVPARARGPSPVAGERAVSIASARPGVRRGARSARVCARSRGRSAWPPARRSTRARCSPGDLFVALRGEHVDGHDFAADAVARGAAALAPRARRCRTSRRRGVATYYVDDALAAMQELGAAWRRAAAGAAGRRHHRAASARPRRAPSPRSCSRAATECSRPRLLQQRDRRAAHAAAAAPGDGARGHRDGHVHHRRDRAALRRGRARTSAWS